MARVAQAIEYLGKKNIGPRCVGEAGKQMGWPSLGYAWLERIEIETFVTCEKEPGLGEKR